MKTVKTTTIASALFGVLFAASVLAQSTAFTYQGRLNDGGSAANGFYDFEFSLFDVASGGTAVAGPYGYYNATVSNGLFTAVPDFGAGVFDGRQLWLEIGVQTNGGGGFTILSPRTELTAAPYALYAPNAGAAVSAVSVSGYVPASQLSGTIPPANIGVDTIDADMLLDGAGSGVDADLLDGIEASGFWKTGGNSGTHAGAHFIGTTDDEPFEIHVEGNRAMRIEPNNLNGHIITMGMTGNTIASTCIGSTICGGKNNKITDGIRNTIGCGCGNEIADSVDAVIGGGYLNAIADDSDYGTITGGRYNSIGADSKDGTVAGGYRNGISSNSLGSVVGGGYFNDIAVNSQCAAIAGGRSNDIADNSWHATILGGYNNDIGTAASYSTIAGGGYNDIGDNAEYAFAAGHMAKANHVGTFVWADSTSVNFASSGSNQFLIRASGGVGINKNNPATALDVNGTVTATAFAGSGASLGGIHALDADDGSPANALYVDSAGQVGIGDTTPSSRLEVAGDITLSAGNNRKILLPDGTMSLFVGGQTTDTNPWVVGLTSLNSHRFYVNGAERVRIQASAPQLKVIGNAQFTAIGSGAYAGPVNRTSDGTLTTATSDRRMKQNIETLGGALEKVKALRGVSFEWKDEPRMGRKIGLVAQEVEEVVPEAVFTNPTDGYKGVLYGELVSVLIEGMKEQQAQIDALKAELAVLKGAQHGGAQ